MACHASHDCEVSGVLFPLPLWLRAHLQLSRRALVSIVPGSHTVPYSSVHVPLYWHLVRICSAEGATQPAQCALSYVDIARCILTSERITAQRFGEEREESRCRIAVIAYSAGGSDVAVVAIAHTGYGVGGPDHLHLQGWRTRTSSSTQTTSTPLCA